MSIATLVDATPALVSRPRFVHSRSIERVPPRHGERPFERLVADSFDGPILRLSQKLRLLEEAKNRRIRQGDALDLIASKQRELQARFMVRTPGPVQQFVTRYGAFAAGYAATALAWCLILG